MSDDLKDANEALAAATPQQRVVIYRAATQPGLRTPTLDEYRAIQERDPFRAARFRQANRNMIAVEEAYRSRSASPINVTDPRARVAAMRRRGNNSGGPAPAAAG